MVTLMWFYFVLLVTYLAGFGSKTASEPGPFCLSLCPPLPRLCSVLGLLNANFFPVSRVVLAFPDANFFPVRCAISGCPDATFFYVRWVVSASFACHSYFPLVSKEGPVARPRSLHHHPVFPPGSSGQVTPNDKRSSGRALLLH
jgi:hypothetical protein